MISRPATALTGPRLLREGSRWLGEAAYGLPVLLSSDINTAIYLAAKDLALVPDDQAHRLADQAEELLLAYLADEGQVDGDPDIPASTKIRRWITDRTQAAIAAAMVRAATVYAVELGLPKGAW